MKFLDIFIILSPLALVYADSACQSNAWIRATIGIQSDGWTYGMVEITSGKHHEGITDDTLYKALNAKCFPGEQCQMTRSGPISASYSCTYKNKWYTTRWECTGDIEFDCANGLQYVDYDFEWQRL